MKPNTINIPKAKKTIFLLPKFRAITWKGIIYCKRQYDVEQINKSDTIDSDFLAHETIHIRQAFSMNNSWIRFYLNYVFQYIKNIPLITINIHAPYKLIPTEIEAYLHESNWNYPMDNKPLCQWKMFQKLTLKQKKYIARQYFIVYNKKKKFANVIYDFLITKNISLDK